MTIALLLARISAVLNPMPEVAPLTAKDFDDRSLNIFHPLNFDLICYKNLAFSRVEKQQSKGGKRGWNLTG